MKNLKLISEIAQGKLNDLLWRGWLPTRLVKASHRAGWLLLWIPSCKCSPQAYIVLRQTW